MAKSADCPIQNIEVSITGVNYRQLPVQKNDQIIYLYMYLYMSKQSSFLVNCLTPMHFDIKTCHTVPGGLVMLWFEVTGFCVARLLTGNWFGVVLLLTGTCSTLLVSVSLGTVARHLRPSSSLSTAEKVLRKSSSLSCIASSVPPVVFGGPETVVEVDVSVVIVVMVGTVSLTVVTELPTPLTVPAPGPIAIVEGRVKVVMIVKVPIPICPSSRLPDPVVTVAMLVATVCIKGAVLR